MKNLSFAFTDNFINEFIKAVETRKPVTGLTHNFYRYPARFSPLFARAAINLFTKPGDIVFDPFMGGGTTLVEANALGRCAIGTDISHLAHFISQVKTTLYDDKDFIILEDWIKQLRTHINLHTSPIRAHAWIEKGYQRNISGKNTWPIRKAIELSLAKLDELPRLKQQKFARCVILKTAQWALDCRIKIPSVADFREQLYISFNLMVEGAQEFSKAVSKENYTNSFNSSLRVLCLNRSTDNIDKDPKIINMPPPKLILTSPPYPGVHVLYHRWQVQGRKETPAPFWIANCLDGKSGYFYTFGDRNEKELKRYFEQLYASYTSIARIINLDTLLVQLVAFSEPTWQLPRYLEILDKAGYYELKFSKFSNSSDGRLWRTVPNRKWYAEQKGVTESSKEIVLFHRLRKT